jgi:hypothetical protein
MQDLINELITVRNQIAEDAQLNNDETIHAEWRDKLTKVIEILELIDD